MKKTICILILAALILSLFSCGNSDTYPPVESTEDEMRTVMTMEIDGTEYSIKYELYRALFASFAYKYDEGYASFWAKEEAEEARALINRDIADAAADIYAVLHHANKIGYDPYSKDADREVDRHIKNGVEGSAEDAIEGFGGDYDAYLEYLKTLGLNYSTHVLLIRYALAYNYVITYYSGTVDTENPTQNMKEGALKYTKDDVYDFYAGDDCVRVSVVEINADYIERNVAQARRDKIAGFSSSEEALHYAVSLTAGVPSDILDGVVIGTMSLDSLYYGNVTEVAFDLDINETSPLLDVFTDTSEEYWILYRLEKTEDYFESYYSDIENVYKAQKINELIYETKAILLDSLKDAYILGSINLSEVYSK